MVSCLCFRPSARYETDVDAPAPQTITHNLDVAKQARDAPPAAAASPAARASKLLIDQTSSARDVSAGVDKSPVKAAAPCHAPALDAQTSIWEKLASHEIKSLNATPEPAELPAQAEAHVQAVRTQTPDLTITGTSIKPQPMPAAAAAAGAKPASSKKPWGARTTPIKACSSSDMNTTPVRRPSSARKSNPGTPPSADVGSRVMKPTAASAARAQATIKPKSEEPLWKH